MNTLFWLAGAAFMLWVTAGDIKRHRSDTVAIFPWFAWFDVSREGRPFLYWTCISVQAAIALAAIFFAFYGSRAHA